MGQSLGSQDVSLPHAATRRPCRSCWCAGVCVCSMDVCFHVCMCACMCWFHGACRSVVMFMCQWLAAWCVYVVPYSGKLSREKTFVNFVVLWLYVNVFSTKFGAWCPLARQKRAMRKSFICENRIFTNSLKFSPLKVSHYTVS